jgi:hypothetical protein
VGRSVGAAPWLAAAQGGVLGAVSGAWTRVRLSESRCGDRQEQEGKRLPAHLLVRPILG